MKLNRLALLLSLAALAEFLANDSAPFTQTVFRWLAAGEVTIDWSLRLDSLSAVMLFFVTFVGFLIHVYSIGYMHGESPRAYARYFAYLNLFIFSMLVPIIFYGLEILVGFIQALVFSGLTLIYLTLATTPHGGEEHH